MKTKNITIEIKKNESGCIAIANGVNVGAVCGWFNNTHAAVMSFGIRSRKGLAIPELTNCEKAFHGFMTKASAIHWLEDVITRYFRDHGYNAKVVNA